MLLKENNTSDITGWVHFNTNRITLLALFTSALFQFVPCVENTRKSSDKKLRNKIFLQKLEREKEVVNLSLLPTLPSCEANVQYFHIVRAEYVALIFRNSNQMILNLEGLINLGLDERGRFSRSVFVIEMKFNNCSLTA